MNYEVKVFVCKKYVKLVLHLKNPQYRWACSCNTGMVLIRLISIVSATSLMIFIKNFQNTFIRLTFVGMEEFVVLVNPGDEVLGLMEKQQAHVNGLLHRAFSVFLFNSKGEMLLQKRATGKYHSPNQWTNAVCSHPRSDESYLEGARRRVKEELGIDAELSEKFSFIYKANVGSGLWEHELDHVFTGTYEDEFHLNREEVEAVRYISMEELDRELSENPEHFTEWFKIILQEYKYHLRS